MKRKAPDQNTKRRFFILGVTFLSILFSLTQGIAASEPVDLLHEKFSLENLANRNLFSPQTIIVVNTVTDTSDSLPGDGACQDNVGTCSLRAAIQEANAFGGAQTIDFDIPPGCGSIITPLSPLPDITDSVTIDGYSHPGALGNTAATGDNAVICVEIDGSSAGASADGLKIQAINTTVRGLAIGRFGFAGIEVNGNGAVIEGNFLGTESSGSNPRPNFHGLVVNASTSRIGGTTLLARNIMSANTRFGIAISQPATGNTVQNNYVGLNSSSGALGNGESGISIFRASGNLIGGPTVSARNVISANGTLATGGLDGSGIFIFGSSPLGQAPNNTVQGNYIGTNPIGAAALGNKHNGVLVSGAIGTTISGNLVSGNLIDGIGMTGAGATGTVVKGNTVGLDASRINALGNARDGISIFQIPSNTIGGTNAGDGNWVGSNGQYGIQIIGTGAESNSVLGNFIGFNVNNTARPQSAGVAVFANNNTVGGTAAGARNFVASNTNWGILVAFSSGNTVSGNYVGLTPNGAALGNANGVYIQDAINNTVGGTAAGAGNVVSGNLIGVRLIQANTPTTGNQVLGNLIGTNANGTSAIPNIFQGIVLQAADNNIIGGTTAAARNLISGNTGDGLSLQNNSKNNQVLGNYVGTKADGLAALPNDIGVKIDGGASTGNVIGGTALGAGNLISGNSQSGVQLQSSAVTNRVEGNIIGLNADGSASLPNANGVYLKTLSTDNTIGGSAAGAGNLISGNTGSGVVITDGAFANFVQGNKIGTDPTGALPRANGTGISITEGTPTGSMNNLIGGATVGARNLISGNGGGVYIQGLNSRGNAIKGNYIGSQADGIGYLGNASFGINLDAPLNTVGGFSTNDRNVISGQITPLTPGILISSNGTQEIIQNNYIGTTADGSNYLFNGTGITCFGSLVVIDSNLISGSAYGVYLSNMNTAKIINNVMGLNAAQTAALGNGDAITIDNSSGIIIGDDGGTPKPNVIAGNGRNGIVVIGNSSSNLFRQNSIYNNALLGIDLGNDGVTQNDNQDFDSGPNHQQNFPVITNVSTVISGNLNSTPNRSFRLEFFSSPTANASGFGEGRTFVTETTVTTNGSGNTTFSIANPQPLGSYIAATATDLTTNETSEFSAWKQTLAPTAVNFSGARATAYKNGVLVEWQTGRESGNLGFNVYRENASGKRELVTPNLVAGSALTASENLLSEQNYSWFDEGGDQNSAYFIEAEDIAGAKEIYGAFKSEASMPENEYSAAADSVTLNRLGQTETDSTVTVLPASKPNAKPSAEQIRVQNTLASSKGVKLTVRRAGIYRVTAAELFANGLPINANAANLRLFADGTEQPITVTGAESGVFGQNSAIEFYGIPANTTETDARVYYLVASSGTGLRIAKTDAPGQPGSAGFYSATVERRDRTIYFSGLLNGDDENFFGAVVNTDGAAQTINAAQLAPGGGAAELEISLQGITRNSHSVNVELNGSLVSTFSFNELERGTVRIPLQSAQLIDGANTVRLVANNQSDISLVDFVRLTYPHLYRAENNSLNLSANGGQEVTIGNFTSKNIRVFDVTNPDQTIELAAHLLKTDADGLKNAEGDSANLTRNYAVKFTPGGGGARNLFAIADSGFGSVTDIAVDNSSNLRDRRNAADLVIVTRREYFDALTPLVKQRTKQGLIVNLVDTADIYDEFSFGQKSTAAIKGFLNYAATNWVKKPQFVLLAGDATFDPKGYLGNPSADVVQTKLVDTESIETSSDEWLTDFDTDGVGELALGRLPARSSMEMSAMVAKIVGYDRQTPANSAAFVADLNDGGYDFAAANQTIASLLPESVGVTQISRTASDAKTQLFAAINNGQSIISYSGHGSTGLWRGNLLTNTDAAGMSNGTKLPMFLMMTCLNGYFQNPTTDSLSETLIKNPRGGAVAVLASSGTTTPDVETELGRRLVSALYGGQLTLGQAVREAKRTVANTTVRQTWIFLGDPSMRLK
jgi:CSLREA domain-containing protein